MKLYGWPVSPYTQKTRSYLKTRGIPFEEVQPTTLMLARRIKRAVGQAIMPTVQLDDGTWLQDSAVIIDWMEDAHPEETIAPPGPTQRLAARLIELYADEWLPMAALHYRWNVPDNAAFALDEFGRYGLPWLPLALSRPLSRRIGGKMAGYLPRLGVTEQTIAGLESVTTGLIAGLQDHLSRHDFLLGQRPCIGDFALFGPLWAHLYRDPGTTALFDAAPAVRAWLARLENPSGMSGRFLEDDVVPESLDFLFTDLFTDLWPHVTTLQAAIDTWVAENPEATRVPRSLGPTPFTLGGTQGERRLITFLAWKAQRPLDARDAIEDREATTAWLGRVGGEALLTAQPAARQRRRGFRLVLD